MQKFSEKSVKDQTGTCIMVLFLIIFHFATRSLASLVIEKSMNEYILGYPDFPPIIAMATLVIVLKSLNACMFTLRF